MKGGERRGERNLDHSNHSNSQMNKAVQKLMKMKCQSIVKGKGAKKKYTKQSEDRKWE